MSARDETERDGWSDLAALYNSGPDGKQAALLIATVIGKRFDQEHPTPARCPICQRHMPCPKHEEHK